MSMFRRFIAFFVATIVAGGLMTAFVAPSAEAATTSTKVVCKTKTVNVRKTPNTRYRAVGSIKLGTVVSGVVRGAWTQLASGPYAGKYVSTSYLCNYTPPAPAYTPPPAPAPAPAPVTSGYAPGTNVHYTQSQQVLVATQTGGSAGNFYGTWARYQWNGSAWAQVGDTSTQVRFGKNGVADGNTRVMGSYTTPTGTYALPFAFGEGNPGTAMPYQTITACSWWLGTDAFSIGRPDLFNRWYEACSGSYPNSEDMSYYRDKGFYRQGVVVAHNYYDPRKSSGPGSSSGIFLHYTPAGGYTAGCIGLTNLAELTNTVRWLNPSTNPVIVIR